MVRIDLKGLPPSSNNAYFNMKGGGRTLSDEGRKYKNETKTFIAQNYAKHMKYFVPNVEYTIFFQLTFLPTDFYNKSFGKKKGSESLIKKLDISNRVKLVEDALKDATSIDDSCTTLLGIRKVPGDVERTTIFVWRQPDDPDPFTLILEQLAEDRRVIP